MSQTTHNVFVLCENLARKGVIKSCFVISQKRPINLAWQEGHLLSGTDILLCDISSPGALPQAIEMVKARRLQGGDMAVIFVFDAAPDLEAAKRAVIQAGLESAWRSELTLDSKAHWARMLGVLELAAKRNVEAQQSNGGGQPQFAVAARAPAAAGVGAAMPRQGDAAARPRPPQGQPAGAPAQPSFRPGRKRPLAVLLVDDSANAREFVIEKLKSSWDQDFIFDTAETGQQAKEKCQQKKYDILFLDVVLPDLDGYAVCKNLKNTKNLNSLAVMLTSKGGAFDKLKGVMSGCDMYLVKPLAEADIKALAKRFEEA